MSCSSPPDVGVDTWDSNPQPTHEKTETCEDRAFDGAVISANGRGWATSAEQGGAGAAGFNPCAPRKGSYFGHRGSCTCLSRASRTVAPGRFGHDPLVRWHPVPVQNGEQREQLFYLSGAVRSGQYVRCTTDRSVFVIAKPKVAVPDLVHSDDLDVIVSDDFLGTMQELGAAGFESRPITLLRGRQREAVRGHHLLVVTGRSPGMWWGFHDEHVRETQCVEGGPWVAQHACLDPAPSGWDGSDLFMPEGTGFLVATHRVVEALRARRLAVLIEPVGTVAFGVDDFGDDADAVARWRRRTGVSPGERAGEPICAFLVVDQTQVFTDR